MTRRPAPPAAHGRRSCTGTVMPPLPVTPDARDAETALLGAALTHSGEAGRLLARIEIRDLGDPTHRIVLAVLRQMLAAGEATEPTLLHAALHRYAGTHRLAARPWAIVVADLVAGAGHPALSNHYLRALLEARIRREAAACAVRIEQAARTGTTQHLWAALSASTSELGLTLARLAETLAAPAQRPSPRLRAVHAATTTPEVS